MDFANTVTRKFDPGKHFQAVFFAGADCLVNARNVVVIGKRHGFDAVVALDFHDLFRREHTVAFNAVRMQIYFHNSPSESSAAIPSSSVVTLSSRF